MDEKEKIELQEIQKQIGIKLSQLRLLHQITLKTLSVKTGIGAKKLSLYEIGITEVVLKDLVVLAFYFNCSVDDFFNLFSE